MAADAWLGPLFSNVDTWQVGFREFIAAAVWPYCSKPIIHSSCKIVDLSVYTLHGEFQAIFQSTNEFLKWTKAQKTVSISLIFPPRSRLGEAGEPYLQGKLQLEWVAARVRQLRSIRQMKPTRPATCKCCLHLSKIQVWPWHSLKTGCPKPVIIGFQPSFPAISLCA